MFLMYSVKSLSHQNLDYSVQKEISDPIPLFDTRFGLPYDVKLCFRALILMSWHIVFI